MDQDQNDPNQESIATLIARALSHLGDRGYSERTCGFYKQGWDELIQFAETRDLSQSYIRDIEPEFLASRGTRLDRPNDITWSDKEVLKGLRGLREYQETGRFHPRKRAEAPAVPLLLRQAQEHHETFCTDHLHHRATTIATAHRAVTGFLVFIASQGICTVDGVSIPLVERFIAERAKRLRPNSLATELGCVRSFLRYLSMQGSVAPELAAQMRSLRFSKEHRLPPVWPTGSVETLLAAVDRSTAIGKRDYAILMLASRLGLRAGDIRILKIENFHWGESRLSFAQAKTGRQLSLPLDQELGQAIIDYLRQGRPSSRFREIFLRAKAPYEPLRSAGAMHHIVTSAMHLAGIKLPDGMPHGLHALRHTLATGLVLSGRSLETVAAILGHRSIESTRIYTHLDVGALRAVALDPEEVCHA